MKPLFRDYALETLKGYTDNTLVKHLGIEVTEIGERFIRGKMPVDHRTKQPSGLLHGGASAAFAETLGSIGSFLSIDEKKQHCVGLEINANHISAMSEGYVEGIAHPLHLGKRTQVWEIKITNPKGKLVCISRLTLALLDKQS